MITRPTVSNRQNPCPTCESITGACRILEDSTVFCHTFVDAVSGEKVNGYICVKPAAGHTATFKLDNSEEWTEERKRSWEAEKAARQQKAKEEERDRQQRALPAKKRHELYSNILDQLTLDPGTIADLQRRGFTQDEIERSGFKSVKKWQKLSEQYDVSLPGIGKGDNTLIVPGDGCICPVKNVYGEIVGFQVRLDSPIHGTRYFWLSSAKASVKTKEFDELPLAIYIPSCLKNLDIQFVEGTGFKPYLASERLGMITIGASGGNHIGSPKTLKHTIETIQEVLCQIALENGSTLAKLETSKNDSSKHGEGEKSPSDSQTSLNSTPESEKKAWLYRRLSQLISLNPSLMATNGLSSGQKFSDIQKQGNTSSQYTFQIVVTPDAGWALNWQVKQKLADTLDWLKSKFSQSVVSVLDWNQIHKSLGDIDELDDLSIVRTLKAESFLKKYKEVFDHKGFASKRYHEWAQTRVKLTADIVQHEKWLSIPEDIQNECDLLLVRKSLGGGKTQGLIEFLKPLDIVSLLVGYRNSLLNNTISRANKMGLNATHIKDVVEKIKGDYVNFAADDSVRLWGGCADSFFKFNSIISHNPEYYFVHDEICSVLGHLKGGGTLKGRQQQAIEWDVETIRNSKFCIMMDANLSDKEVDFMRQLFPEKRIKVLDSVYSTTPRTFYFVETESDSKEYTTGSKFLSSQLVEIAKAANKVLWISDSQRSCETADEILTKHGQKHFRLDGKTSHDELAKQLQSDPKQFILTENLDSLSLSPSGESGLSIDLYDYFDVVCLDIHGTVGVNTLTQLSARLRDTKVPIYVACPEFVNMTCDPCPYAIKNVNEVLNQRIEQLLIQAMYADKELVDSQYVADMFTDMAQKFASDPWFIESLKDAKQLKYEHQNLKLTLKTALAQAGNRVIDFIEKADEEQFDEVKETKELVKRREAEKIFNAPDIDWEKAQELAKQDANYDVQCQIRKARLKHQLPGIEDTPSWNADFIYTVLFDQTKFLDQRWRLKQLEDEELFKAIFKFEKKYNFEFGFTANDAWKSNSIKIEALKLLGVGKLIEAGSLSAKVDLVQSIVHEYYNTPEWFNLIGIPRAKEKVNKEGTVTTLNHVTKTVDRFLDYFGLERGQEKKNRGERSYSISTPEAVKDYLPDIDSCLSQRAISIIEEMREVSLKEIIDKAEEAKKLEQQGLEQQSELNKRMLENQLKQSEYESGGVISFFSYITNENHAPFYRTQNTPSTEMEESGGVISFSSYITNKNHAPLYGIQNTLSTEIEGWNKPESIVEVVQLLSGCEDAETLALLRQCEIPADVFKLAARQLPQEQREQIRQWVVSQNADSA